MALFKVLRGREELGSYRFDGGSVRIGRQQDCEIRLVDQAVSRNHAEVSRKGDSWVLRIREARNGIFVNGNLVSFRVLKSGDCIEIGHFVIKFDNESTEGPEASSQYTGDEDGGGETTVNISLSDAMAIHNMNKDVMGAHLAWYGETETQNVVGLSGERTVIGSLMGCEARLPESLGSTGLCAAVVKSATGYDLELMQDARDVKVNARPVLGATRLSDGDRIQLGNYILLFHEPLD
jgi:pSer/pThr/pTyr-binding forkhead associated (FHA) protein